MSQTTEQTPPLDHRAWRPGGLAGMLHVEHIGGLREMHGIPGDHP